MSEEKEFYTKKEVDEKLWELAIATNAMVKGLLGAMGIGGSINKEVYGIEKHLNPELGYENLKEQMLDALAEKELQKGDVIVISEKLFTVSQGRLFPFEEMIKNDPKKMDDVSREKMAAYWEEKMRIPITPIDLVSSDTYVNNAGETVATLGIYNPNRIAYEMAELIKKRYGVPVDVIISDTDTGVDICQELIGCMTIGATPLGATKGLCLYECMRATVSGEFVRGSNKGIPIVICRPIKRHNGRPFIGDFRGYEGRLDAKKENGIAFENCSKEL